MCERSRTVYIVFSVKLRSRFVNSRNAQARAGIRIPSHDRA